MIAEHRRKEKLEEAYGALGRTRLLEQGDAALSFYKRRQLNAVAIGSRSEGLGTGGRWQLTEMIR